MTRTTNVNYSAADATLGNIAFQIADSDNDLFDRFDIAKLAKAVDVHTHDGAGKGLVTSAITVGSVSQAITTSTVGGLTTAATSPVDMDGVNLSVTMTPATGTTILVFVDGSGQNNTANGYTAYSIFQDGLTQGEMWVVTASTANAYGAFGGGHLLTGTVGVPTTIRLRWRVPGGSVATLYQARFCVVELKK